MVNMAFLPNGRATRGVLHAGAALVEVLRIGEIGHLRETGIQFHAVFGSVGQEIPISLAEGARPVFRCDIQPSLQDNAKLCGMPVTGIFQIFRGGQIVDRVRLGLREVNRYSPWNLNPRERRYFGGESAV